MNLAKVALVTGSPSSARRPTLGRRPQRAVWVLAWLWFLVALMPLRAWATAEAMVTMAAVSDAGNTAAQTFDLPPCHEPVGHASDDAELDDSHASCAACIFCAPLIAPATLDGAVSCLANATPLASIGGYLPEGPADTLFRPPRG